MDDLEPLVEIIGRRTAARRIALALHRGEHHVIGCTGSTTILTTTAALHGTEAVHYLVDFDEVTVAGNPLPEELREQLRQAAAWCAVSLVLAAGMPVGILAGRIGCTPTPDSAPAVFHRRPAKAPDRPPPLLREALRRLAAYERNRRIDATRLERRPR